VRKPLNKLLENCGYRIEKISRFSVLLERLYRKTPNFKFVQVGANDGVSFDELYNFVTTRRCSGLVIEPLPDVFEVLRLNYLHHPRIVPVNIAVHANRTAATLYRVAADKIAALEKPWAAGIASFSPEHALNLGIPPELITEQTVPCAPLMEVLAKHGALDAQMLQIDTEGYDPEVVKMIDFSRFRPALLKYEKRGLTTSLQTATQDLLKRAGYRIIQDGSDTVASLD
jgi:FkbM family methyltransferase